MNPRHACLACLDRTPAAPMEAALWVAVEHSSAVNPSVALAAIDELQREMLHRLPSLPAIELAQPLLRALSAAGFQLDDDVPLRPRAALFDQVIARRRGQPLSIALLALGLAERLGIPLVGINFPGYFLLKVPGADHLLDPCGGRRLYPRDCRDLLLRQFGEQAVLSGAHFEVATPRQALQRLSRNLRHLHRLEGDLLASLKDAERVLELGSGTASDYLARAELYEALACPQAARYDLQHALLLTDSDVQRLMLQQRLAALRDAPALH